MQIILRDDLDNLGKSGEVVNVKPGYARNYLLPRGLAIKALGDFEVTVKLGRGVNATVKLSVVKKEA